MNFTGDNLHRLTSWVSRKQWLLLIILFLTISLAIVIPRALVPYTWDDTLILQQVETEPISREADPPKALLETAYQVWRDDASPTHLYRPLDRFAHTAEALLWSHQPLIPTLIHAIILGAIAVFVYLLVLELTRRRFVALATSVFCSLSIPALQGTWVLLSKQPLLPFFTVLGLLSYILYLKYRRPMWLVLLCICGLLGPFLRELAIILPVTVIAHMLLERRWNRGLLISLPILLAHALYPSFLPNLILFGRVVLAPVFSRSLIGTSLNTIPSEIWQVFSVSIPSIPYRIATFMPPTIIVVALAFMLFYLFTQSKQVRNVRLIVGIVIAVTVLILGFAFFTGSSAYILAILFYLFIPLVSLRFDKLLPVWFLVSSLPFFIMPLLDVHLWIASIPWIAMILLWVDQLLRTVTSWATSARWTILARLAYPVIIGILLIGFIDQCLNIIAVNSTFSGIAATENEMGDWFTTNAREGSAVITDFRHGFDLDYFTKGEVNNFFIYEPGFGFLKERIITDRTAQEQVVAQHFENTDAYYLMESLTLASPEEAYSLLKHRFDPVGEVEFRELFITNGHYPFLDPLENLAPPVLQQFAGPPDLWQDMLLTKQPFRHEFFSAYYLYQTTEYTPRDASLLQRDYKGFDILFYAGKYYGIQGGIPEGISNPKDYIEAFEVDFLTSDRVERLRQDIDIILGGEDNEEMWASGPGALVSKEDLIISSGNNSLKASWNKSQDAVYLNFPSQDWTDFHYIMFSVYGSGSNSTMQMQLRFHGQGGKNWVQYRWNDNFTGWKLLTFPLEEYARSSGDIDWKDIRQILFRPTAPQSLTLYFDALMPSQELGTDTAIGKTAFTEIYNDDETVWHAEPRVTVNEETTIVKEGESSLKVVWDNSQSAVYYNLPSKQDWSGSKHVKLYVYGANSGAPMAMQVRFKGTGGQNWVGFRWIDDFGGWKPMLFELEKPDQSSGDTDWTDVQQVLFRPPQKPDGTVTIYVDHLIRDLGTSPAAPPIPAPPTPMPEPAEQTLSIEVYDDDETAWATEPGATINEETTIVKEGESSLKVTWDNSQSAIYYNFPDKQGWSDSTYISLHVYGASSGTPMVMQVRFRGYGGGDWVDFKWTDDFIGWKTMVFELEEPSQSSGITDWTDVQQVLFRPLAKPSITLYFDGLALDEPAGATPEVAPQPVVQPAEEIYYGFRIEPWAGKYYAIPQAEGEFDIQRIENNDYSQYFSANSTDQLEELITGNLLEGTKSIEVYDDFETLWRSEPSATRSEEKTIVKEGTSSLKAVWENSQGAVYYNFRSSQSWYKSKYVSFYVYGANSGTTMVLQIRSMWQGGSNWIDFKWVDDFSGWKRLVFELDNPSATSGQIFWTNMQQVLFRPLIPHSATLYFDQLMWHK